MAGAFFGTVGAELRNAYVSTWFAAIAVLALLGLTGLMAVMGLLETFFDLPDLTVGALSPRSALSWIDPAFVLYVSDGVVLAPSVPAMATVLLLGALVGVNGAMAVETIVRRPPACTADGTPWWAVAALPSFLASFSCCAPTVLLLLGAGAAGAVISLIPFVVPAAGLLLVASLVWSARRLESASVLVAG